MFPACSFTQAMLSQPRMDSLDSPMALLAGLLLLGIGSMLVLSSFFALGFTGTFLGKTPRTQDLGAGEGLELTCLGSGEERAG